MNSGDLVIVMEGEYRGQRGWVLGWQGDNPIVMLPDATVTLSPRQVRVMPRATRR